MNGLHVSSQYGFEHLFWTNAIPSILLNASSMSADEDFHQKYCNSGLEIQGK
jgi:hypothetical protein